METATHPTITTMLLLSPAPWPTPALTVVTLTHPVPRLSHDIPPRLTRVSSRQAHTSSSPPPGFRTHHHRSGGHVSGHTHDASYFRHIVHYNVQYLPVYYWTPVYEYIFYASGWRIRMTVPTVCILYITMYLLSTCMLQYCTVYIFYDFMLKN